ncbi:MAG: xanthine dehydrogenase family protein subunit M [Burkholderiales bacterium]|nr:xanthine dehydrogenase family protein subunit M [Burkholderiales bacterium]
MRDFEFLEPADVAEASRMLAAHGEDCRAYAGGTALLLALRQRLVAPTHLVSLGRIPALSGVRFDAAAGLRIGALTRHAELAAAPEVLRHYPMLAGMAAHLANPQVRNQGTLGGNLCYADPATDPPTCLLGLDAEVEIASARGTRRLPIGDFFVDYYTTALAPDEILVAVHVPPPAADAIGRYTRFLRTPAEHRPLVNVAVTARRSGGAATAVRVAVGASTPIPARVPRAEALLEGRAVTAELAAAAAAAAADDIFAVSDGRGDEAYRRAMVRVVLRRTLAALFDLPGE